MRQCPDCKKINDDSSAYCSGCGSTLAKPVRTRSFRNFIITISIIFSVVLMGLIILFLLNGSGLKEIFRQQAAGASSGTEDTGIGDSVRKDLYDAGHDQEKVLSIFGYPDQFVILFDEPKSCD